MKDTMMECARKAGALLLEHFGRVRQVRIKENQSSVVTEADLASEALILDILTRRFPDHGVLGEEGGHLRRGARFTWVIDPLDGTSNFAAGLPWFGVMIALLDDSAPQLGVMYLPVEDRLYLAERGAGATCNGQPVRVTESTDLSRLLCAYALDPSMDPGLVAEQATLLGLLVQRARNVRATNSLVDFACTIDGRLGACLNHNTKLWDIAAASLVMEEAGGAITDLRGQPLRLDLGPEATTRNYAVLGANPVLSRQILELIAASGLRLSV
jgi:myo-inositol-1(or 4)-monophosphatase